MSRLTDRQSTDRQTDIRVTNRQAERHKPYTQTGGQTNMKDIRANIEK